MPLTRQSGLAAFALAVVLLVATAATGGAAAGVGYRYDPDLSWWAVNSLELASEYTGAAKKTVPYRTYIRCYTSTDAFEAPLRAKGAATNEIRGIIAYYAGQGSINLRAGTCTRARRFASARPLVTAETAAAIATMLHETLHRQGIDDERITECFANEAVKYAGWLAHWNSLKTRDDTSWTASEEFGDRAMNLAFAESSRLVATDYLMPKDECLRLVRSFSWAEYRRPSGGSLRGRQLGTDLTRSPNTR